MAKFVSFLYQLARTANDIEKITSGSRKVSSRIYRWPKL